MNKRISSVELKNRTFYQFPKFLMLDDNYRSMSNDSKILYMLLYERLRLSLVNNWIDKNGHGYIKYSTKRMMEILNCKSEKLTKLKNELRKYNLIEEVRLGLNKSNIIYVLECSDSKFDLDEFEGQKNQLKYAKTVDSDGTSKIENPLYDCDTKTGHRADFIKNRSMTGSSKIEFQEIRKSNTSNNNYINNNLKTTTTKEENKKNEESYKTKENPPLNRLVQCNEKNNIENDVVVEIKSKIDKRIGTITKKSAQLLLKQKSIEIINKYIYNFNLFDSIKKRNDVGFFINAVLEEYDFPKTTKTNTNTNTNTNNYEQREYTKDFYDSLYSMTEFID